MGGLKMMNIKFEVIRDFEGQVEGYKLGNWYLMKYYTWMNDYCWIINKDGRNYYFWSEFNKAMDNGEVQYVSSCKKGKQILIDRFMEEK